jgi:hypothetical protein
MRGKRPSPALVVSIIALVVACAGTATAAGVIITRSSQIKNGAVTGADIRNRSIHGGDIAKGTIRASNLAKSARSSVSASSVGSAGDGATAIEAVRKVGPADVPGGQSLVATLPKLAPGTYAILAKTTITADTVNLGLGELFRADKTGNAECVLDAGGDQDNARQTVASPGSLSPSTVNLQMTRTLGQASDITLTCSVNDYKWKATDTSILAIKLASSSRTEVSG